MYILSIFMYIKVEGADVPFREAQKIAEEKLVPMNQGLELTGSAMHLTDFMLPVYIPRGPDWRAQRGIPNISTLQPQSCPSLSQIRFKEIQLAREFALKIC